MMRLRWPDVERRRCHDRKYLMQTLSRAECRLSVTTRCDQMKAVSTKVERSVQRTSIQHTYTHIIIAYTHFTGSTRYIVLRNFSASAHRLISGTAKHYIVHKKNARL